MTRAFLLLSSSPVCDVLLHLKGLVLPTSSPATQASVCSNSGCVMDGTTALMEQMNTAVTTPPILPSVSLVFPSITRISPESHKMSESNTLKMTFFHSFTPMCSVSSCEAIEVEMCRGLSYSLTSFPNIWLSIADQREAAALLQQYRVKPLFTSCIHHCMCM